MFHVKHFAEIFMNSTLDMKIKRNFRECRNGEKMARGLGKGIDVLIPEVKTKRRLSKKLSKKF